MNLHFLSRRKAHSSTAPWLRRCALGMSGVFAWSVLAAIPAQALARPAAPPVRDGARPLRPDEMRQMIGRQAVIGGGGTGGTGDTGGGGTGTTGGAGAPAGGSLSPDSGGAFSWEASAGGTNTGNGNKTTTLPLAAWTQRGGLPVNFSLTHNSRSSHNSVLGQKWTHSYDIYLAATTGGTGGMATVGGGGAAASNMSVHWGDDLSYPFTNDGSNNFAPPTGIYDSLVQNVDGTYTLTRKDQTRFHFNTALSCDSISDENGNALAINYNANSAVASIVDATGRTLALAYDANNRIASVTDPLNRTWTLTYDANGNLSQINEPLLAAQTAGTGSHASLGYDANNNVASLTSAAGRTSLFSYNADGSVAWQQDAMGSRATYTYANGQTVITDANGHALTYTYTNGKLTGTTDAQNNSIAYTYDAANNKTSAQDQRGKTTTLTYDSRGNALTSTDPLGNTTTITYNSHNKPLTAQDPLGNTVSSAYDGADNLTGVAFLDSGGATRASESYVVDAHGLTTDHYDANHHRTQYGHNANGDLTNVTTPNGHLTAWTFNGLGAQTGRTDAMGRATTYTRDAWQRVTAINYPSALQNKTFGYDADGKLMQFGDATGATNRSYDADGRLLSESKGGSTLVSHAYDATGKAGLLSTTTDANGRVLTYSYDSLNRLAGVSETTGTTSYTYDAAGHETGIVNANSTTVAKTYDDDGQLTNVVNANGAGTTLSSFSYVYDANSRRHTCTEANGDMVTYGYDYAGHLTGETRTGSSAYSLTYTLDPVGNRLSQTKGAATTAFTLDGDDELTATTSSTGGFVNTYGYNANGEQTGRTLSGTAYTLAYDYEGQISGITQGTGTTAFTYDAGGRRTSRTAGGVTTSFVYDGASILLEKQSGATTATYTYGNALVRKDGETPLYDGQGSERTVTNSSQAVTGTLTSSAFGQTVASTGSSSSSYMYAATSGYRNDGDAGLSKVGCRYYDAQTGTFTSRDTYLDQKPYLYCEHDPVNHLDPTGHDALDGGLGLLGGILAGAGIVVELLGGPAAWGIGLAIAGLIVALRPIYHGTVELIEAINRRYPEGPKPPRFPPGTFIGGASGREIVGPDGTVLGRLKPQF